MLKIRKLVFTVLLGILSIFFLACDKESTDIGTIQVLSLKSGDFKLDFTNSDLNVNIPVQTDFIIRFTAVLDTNTVRKNIKLYEGNAEINLVFSNASDLRTVTIKPVSSLKNNTVYILTFSEGIKGESGEEFKAIQLNFKTILNNLTISNFKIDNNTYNLGVKPQNVKLQPDIQITFSEPLNPATISSETVRMVNAFGQTVNLNYSFSEDNKVLTLQVPTPLVHLSKHYLSLYSDIKGANGEGFTTVTIQFYSEIDLTPKYPVISDNELLTKVQQHTFKYFYDFAHSNSGMARERNSSGDLVTIGGSGFGVMALIVGIERNFITRSQGITRLEKIVGYLETADRFHGAWGHWYNGNTGKLIPFSTSDNGGDIVETSFMAQGLMTVRQYLNANDTQENNLRTRITNLLNAIEWSWYNHDNQNMLSWHWSPTVGWAMNMHIRGYSEALISYVMAASSTTYGIEPIVYTNGWAGTSYFKNGKTFYGYLLPLGFDYGGPLFFAHYSFLGLDPRTLSDTYANYWQQNVNHTLINRAHCVANTKNFIGYSQKCWGLTASDDNTGYGVHEPTRDIGVISPTAALSSMPYTPNESLEVIKFLYYTLGDRVWGEYGFYDAFNATEGWWGKSYLAIDQGPIIVMLENHRTGLLWDLFMSSPEIQSGLNKLGFSFDLRRKK
jgi:hypothetical protein